MDRRMFLMSGGVALTAAASDRLKVALIGAGGRGRYLAGVVSKDAAVDVVAVCDVYEPNLEKGLSELGNKAKAYRNYKQVLENKDIDIVIIATPEHWHHQMMLDAVAAGKDVYLEKPMCQTPEQGAEMVRVARASDRIVQVGMQRRSYDLFLKARDVVQGGQLGDVRMVRSWWLNNRLNRPTERTLEGPLDWEQWQGPAVKRQEDPHRFFNWRAYSDYSGGIVADQGAHVFDAIHLVMDAGFPSAVNASAGLIHTPKIDTPESVVVAAEYEKDDFVAVFTINYAAMKYYYRNDQLNQYDGDKARMDLGREELSVFKQGQEDKPVMQEVAPHKFSHASEVHMANLLESVRTRKTPTAPVELGFQAALVIMLANASLKQGRRIRWNSTTMKMES
jgi:predicted dehydrogenase